MSEYADILRKAAEQPHHLTDSDIAALRRACREYPADAVAPALLLKYASGELDREETSFAQARVALYSGAPGTLIRSIDPTGKGFDSFYPPLPTDNRPSTSSAIDIFLETYGHQSAEEDALLERMIFNPVPDYSEQLARETKEVDPAKPGSQEALIDAFLASVPSAAETPSKEEKEEPKIQMPKRASKKVKPTPSLLSLSLAKIFIKQGRFERAYEIISNLSLNYPEKSVYFADQMRFLEKLIINQRHAKETQDNQ